MMPLEARKILYCLDHAQAQLIERRGIIGEHFAGGRRERRSRLGWFLRFGGVLIAKVGVGADLEPGGVIE